MKKVLSALAVSLLATSAFANTEVVETVDPTTAYTSSGEAQSTLTAVGEITQSTCAIETGSLNKTVELPTVASNQLRVANSTAGKQAFSITLADCPATYLEDGVAKNSVALSFLSSDSVSEKGNLKNVVTNGSNVEVQILNHEDQVINLTNNENNTQKIALSSYGTYPQFNFSAQYFAAEPATAGSFRSSVPFKVAYK